MNILIVGAGPAGSYSAYLLAKQGHTVAIVEEHSEVGTPVQCTGILTSKIENFLRMPSYIIKTKIEKARIFAPSGEFVDLDMIPNLIIDRSAFDKFLSEKAQNAGAQLFLSHRFIGQSNGQVQVKDLRTNEIRNFLPEIIIGADGPNSCVAKSFGFEFERTFLIGAQATVEMENENTVNFYPTPEGISWSVPEGNNLYRVGVAVYKNPNVALNNFLAKFSNKKICGYQGGLIPIYNPNAQIQKGNVYLVGDAASQVKATTAGGIIQSLTAAKCLADSIITGKSYTKLARNALGKELWLHLKIRNAMDRFTDEDYNNLVKYTNTPKIKELLKKNDRDDLFSFFFKMLWHEPRYLKFWNVMFRKPSYQKEESIKEEIVFEDGNSESKPENSEIRSVDLENANQVDIGCNCCCGTESSCEVEKSENTDQTDKTTQNPA